METNMQPHSIAYVTSKEALDAFQRLTSVLANGVGTHFMITDKLLMSVSEFKDCKYIGLVDKRIVYACDQESYNRYVDMFTR